MLRPLGILVLGLPALAFGALGGPPAAPTASGGAATGPGDLVVYPYGLMDGVRRTDLTVPMQVQLYNQGTGPLQLQRLEVLDAGGSVLHATALHGETLPGDGGRVRALYRAMEWVDPDLSHRHRQRVYVPLEDRVPLGPEAEAALLHEILAGVRRLQAEGGLQLRNLRFPVDLARLFPGGGRAGDVAPFIVRVHWTDERGTHRATHEQELAVLPDFLPPPAGHGAARGTGSWRSGDLHVHNCRDEAVGGCDSCAAESFNVTGSFSNADLKTQFQGLGYDYFSTTTHSYCINDAAEFDAVLQESRNLTDPSFVVLCGTEISGKETGPQSGSDSADLLCALGFGNDVFHMGAHRITSRKPGGDDALLQFCDDPMNDQHANVASVRAEGGFSVVNHPAAAYWAFNSVSGLKGQEAGGFTGAEVWNGSHNPLYFQEFQRDWWIARLNEGRLLFPYSGSDTHDAAFDFGATRTWVDGAFTPANLVTALRGGRTYLSNGPFLEVTLRDGGGRSAPMGSIIRASAAQVPPNHPVDVEVAYNLGGDVGVVTVYAGRVGGGESVLLSQGGLSGAGTLSVPATLAAGVSWYRAELRNDVYSRSALTTPVYVALL